MKVFWYRTENTKIGSRSNGAQPGCMSPNNHQSKEKQYLSLIAVIITIIINLYFTNMTQDGL